MLKANQIVLERELIVNARSFLCPYCGTEYARGRQGEAIVKEEAKQHVRECWEVLLLMAGYVITEHNGEAWMAKNACHIEMGFESCLMNARSAQILRDGCGIRLELKNHLA